MESNDLISRSALKAALRKLAKDTDGNIALLVDVNGLICDAPAVDPESRREVARWEYDPNGIDWNLGAWVCSLCKVRNANLMGAANISPYRFSGSRYCPNCGAGMGGNNNE